MMVYRKIGLALMLLAFLLLMVFAATYGLAEDYDLDSNLRVALIMGVPCLFIAALAWLWPKRGGVAAVVLAVCLFAYSVAAVSVFKAPTVRDAPSFAEIAGLVIPYGILLLGSIMALVPACRLKPQPRQALPGINSSMPRLLRMSLLGMLAITAVFVLFYVIALGIGGDSGILNLISGFVMGATAAMPLLVGAVIIWKWPRRGSVVTGAIALAALVYFFVRMLAADPSDPMSSSFLQIPLTVTAGVVLIGSILAFVSVRNQRGDGR